MGVQAKWLYQSRGTYFSLFFSLTFQFELHTDKHLPTLVRHSQVLKFFQQLTYILYNVQIGLTGILEVKGVPYTHTDQIKEEAYGTLLADYTVGTLLNIFHIISSS